MIARQWLFMHIWWHWDFEAVRRCPWRGSLGELANVWMRVGGWSARPRPSAAGVRATCSLESGALMATATVSGASRQNDVKSRELRLQGREKGYIALPREGLRPSRDVRSHDGFTTCQLNTSHIMPFGQPKQWRRHFQAFSILFTERCAVATLQPLAVHHWRDKIRKTRETDLWLEATARSRRPCARRASQRNSPAADRDEGLQWLVHRRPWMPHARRVANDGPAIAVEFDQVFERGVLRGEAWADAKASQVQVSRRADLMAHCVDFCLPSLRSCAVSSLLTKTLGRAEGVRHWKQAAPAHLRSAG